LGLEKDWEKVHLLDAYSLVGKENGCSVDLPKGIVACREYDKVVFCLKNHIAKTEVPFKVGSHELWKIKVSVSAVTVNGCDFKNGFYLDLDKIPKGSVIRHKKDGDVFKKFGGGTKSLGDYLTDKKIPKRERERLPLIAYENQVLAIFGVAISDLVKIDKTTVTAVKLEME
jgi:tRNA(Ile)-lysidine synthase